MSGMRALGVSREGPAQQSQTASVAALLPHAAQVIVCGIGGGHLWANTHLPNANLGADCVCLCVRVCLCVYVHMCCTTASSSTRTCLPRYGRDNIRAWDAEKSTHDGKVFKEMAQAGTLLRRPS